MVFSRAKPQSGWDEAGKLGAFCLASTVAPFHQVSTRLEESNQEHHAKKLTFSKMSGKPLFFDQSASHKNCANRVPAQNKKWSVPQLPSCHHLGV